ncbi:MAG: urease accessory protein UreF [Candidatus Accumulibacter sp.]|uniref:urease accessory protein UreF n=1 Tax=Accumulibacter sp. TaxID=2053492 RepID=UPI001AD37D7C|nr:urease accessory protein UreF [Accumulibacter sp.]MCC2869765.1 urease accessory protein UreF [Candidatus Accumulibacter phosphatis]MBN8517622.1 urease accessory protein UreF [Accumulibacter sp.]MBO3711495.1 urease accessory protein UreF [Accumulibacter sp.]MCM8579389.1 urease accessory protein UreF [Accumulibacter sp.]HNC21456.1 urease accessory protein UreF [Accumulibacter sp.]
MSLALSRLLQLASPALPVGAYTYSQGLEWAVEAGLVKDQAAALEWIARLLENGVSRFEAPLTACLQRAWIAADDYEVKRLNADFLASRESSELRAETVQMGYSLRRLLHELDDFPLPPAFDSLPEVSFPVGWALAAASWEIAIADSLTAYLWSWCENQTMAALKTVPLGQAAGQRILLALGRRLPAVVQQALELPEERWSNFAPGLALASSRHETQYSRLFRS